MIRFTFKRGLVFLEGQCRWQLVRRLPSGKLQFEAEDGELLNLTDADALQRWHKQQWIIDEASLGVLADALYLATPRDLATFPKRHQDIARLRFAYLQHVNPAANPYCPERWQRMIEAAARKMGETKVPAASTVQQWWRRYRLTKDIIQLIPHRCSNCGPRGADQYALFEEIVAQIYLNNQQLPKSAVVDEVFRRAAAINKERPAEDRLRPPGRSTIYRWLDFLRQDILDAARLGADAARVKYRVALGGLKVDSILERIEIDHTPIDLIVVDRLTFLPLGRPWLTLAKDKASRMVVGFYISLNAPSGHSVLQCLRRAILPKADWLARFPDIKGVWPAHGIPDLLAVDNGMDLHSDALEKSCQEMGIQILFCGARTPEHKGSVERFFRTLNMGLIHRLPGTVFSNVDQRGDYPAEELAVIDMEALVHLITKWIVEVYNVTLHRGIGTTPLQKWTELAAQRPIDLPLYPQELEVIIGIPARRTLFHYGLELEGLHYNSQQLQEIRRRAGENIVLDLKFYEDTVGHIHVYDPYAKEYLQVPAVAAEYAAKFPRDIHRLVREQARRRFGDSYSVTQMLDARSEIEAIVRQAIADKKMAQRKGGARMLMHDSESVLNAHDPLEAARRPTRLPKVQPPPELPDGLDDDLPQFPSITGGKA